MISSEMAVAGFSALGSGGHTKLKGVVQAIDDLASNCSSQLFNSQTEKECREDLGHELWPVEGQQICWNPVQEDQNYSQKRLLRSSKLLW